MSRIGHMKLKRELIRTKKGISGHRQKLKAQTWIANFFEFSASRLVLSKTFSISA